MDTEKVCAQFNIQNNVFFLMINFSISPFQPHIHSTCSSNPVVTIFWDFTVFEQAEPFQNLRGNNIAQLAIKFEVSEQISSTSVVILYNGLQKKGSLDLYHVKT